MKIGTAVLVSAALLLVGGVFAAEEKAETKKTSESMWMGMQMGNPTEKGMEMTAAMEKAKERGAPGAHHKALEPFVGHFQVECEMWMKPGEEPMASKGKAKHKWVLDGRFLKMSFEGEMHGEPFEGFGYLGYDNIRGEYTSVWLDSMNTGITRSTGSFDASAKTFTEKGTFSCPMTGEKDTPFRGVWKIVDDDTITYEMNCPGPDGEEMKGMELTYNRVAESPEKSEWPEKSESPMKEKSDKPYGRY